MRASWSRRSDYEAAIAEYEILLKQDPGSLIVANNLASLLSDRRTDKAEPRAGLFPCGGVAKIASSELQRHARLDRLPARGL
jgi:hypothetical protein